MVLIDMNMPENCERCPLRVEFANEIYCKVLIEKGIYFKSDFDGSYRPEICPIKTEVDDENSN